MMETTMLVTLRYFDGCPNWRTAHQRLETAIERTGVDARIRLQIVATQEEAERLRFRGSPTLLIDGEDPFVDETAAFGLSCRIYLTERGLEGAPSEGQLMEALSNALGASQ